MKCAYPAQVCGSFSCYMNNTFGCYLRSVHVKDIIKPEDLPQDSEERWLALPPKLQGEMLLALGLLLMQVADSIAMGRNDWVSFGTTKEKNSYTLSLHRVGGTLTLYGSDPISLVSRASELV